MSGASPKRAVANFMVISSTGGDEEDGAKRVRWGVKHNQKEKDIPGLNTSNARLYRHPGISKNHKPMIPLLMAQQGASDQ